MVNVKYFVQLLFTLFALPIVSYANQDFKKYTESSNKNGCFVDVNLNCRDKKENGNFFYEKIQWLTKTSAARRELYSSSEVQQSFNSCYYFAQLIKTECGISEPVQLIYKSESLANAIESFIMSPNENLSKVSSIPKKFQEYFNDQFKNVPKYYPSKLSIGSEINGFKMSEYGQIVNKNFPNLFIGKFNVKNQCTTTNGKSKCIDVPVTDGNYQAIFEEGVFQIKSQKYGTSFAVDASSFTNARLEYLSTPPYLQIVGDEGIAWAAVNQFAQFKISTGQRLHLTSNVAFKDLFLMMQGDGNLVLRELLTGRVLWQTGAVGECAAYTQQCPRFKYFEASFNKGIFKIIGVYPNGDIANIWQADQNTGDFLEIKSTYPYLAIKYQNNVVWPRANNLSCLNTRPGNVTCLHPEMPLYSQGSKKVLDFVNKNSGSSYSVEQGWCVPTSFAMVGKAYANELDKHYDWTKGIAGIARTNSFLDSNEDSEIIWQIMNNLNMDIKNQTISYPEFGIQNMKTSGVPFNIAIFYDSIYGASSKRILPIDEKYKNIFWNYYFTFQYGVQYIGAPESNVFGINENITSREKRFTEKMPIGVMATDRHAFAINGLETSNILKVFDPWGSVYDILVDEKSTNQMTQLKGIEYASSSEEFGPISLKVINGGKADKIAYYAISGYVPIKHVLPDFQEVNGNLKANEAKTYFSKAKDAIDVVNNDSNINKVNDGVNNVMPIGLTVRQDEVISQDFIKAFNEEIKKDPEKYGVVVDFAKSKPIGKTIATLPTTAKAPEVAPEYLMINKSSNKCVVKRGANLSIQNCDNNSTAWSLNNWNYNGQQVVYILEVNNSGGQCFTYEGEVLSLGKCNLNLTNNFYLQEFTYNQEKLIIKDGKYFKLKKQKKCLSSVNQNLLFKECTSDADQSWALLDKKYLNTVSSPPVISAQPQPVCRRSDESVTLSVTATGSGTLTYQWYKGTTAISGATNATYTFTMASDKEGDYKVKVSNSVGDIISNVVTVKCALVPTISAHPTSVSKKSGDSVTLSVTAIGVGTLFYQWYKGNTAISEATNASYTFKMSSDKAGDYKVKVINYGGYVTSNVATVTYLSVPTITKQPEGGSVKWGGEHKLSVTATGAGTLKYQWYKENTAIKGATNSSYTVTAITSEKDVGNFKVNVSNDYGETTSNVVKILFITKPTITLQPKGVSAKLNDNVTLSVAANGNGVMKYQWSKASVAISGATSSSYTFAMTGDKAGQYNVVVSNEAGEVLSELVTVSYLSPPTITKQPENAYTEVGVSAFLSVYASGSGTLKYQWYKNGKALTGETKLSYFAYPEKIGSKDEYKVVISNEYGSVTSNIATVTGIAKKDTAPIIYKDPIGYAASKDELVILSVLAGGSDSMTYQWYKGEKAISGATSSSYSFNMTSDKIGDYKVKISNKLGSVTSKVATISLPSPKIKIEQQPKDIINGSWSYPYVLSVLASVDKGSTIKYQWYKNGKSIVGATKTTYSFKLMSADEGDYTVKIYTDKDEIISNVAKVSVLKVPIKITKQPSEVSANNADKKYLSVSYEGGTGPLKVQWYKNDKAIVGATSLMYEFSVNKDSVGDYKAVISDDFSSLTSNEVKVSIQLPKITSQPKDVRKKQGESVALTVDATSNGTSLSYRWYKDGVQLPNEVNSGLFFTMSKSKVGAYKVEVYDSNGSVMSNEVQVQILDLPIITVDLQDVSKKQEVKLIITEQPISQELKHGSLLKLTVSAELEGNPNAHLTYQWYKDGELLSNATTSTYLADFVKSREGTYTVKIKYVSGSSENKELISNGAVIKLKAK